MSVFVKWWNQITQSISNHYKKHIINFQYFTSPHYSANSCCQSSEGVSISLSYTSLFPNNCMPLSLSSRNMLLLLNTVCEDVRSHFHFSLTLSHYCIFFDSHYLFKCFKNIMIMCRCHRHMDQKILSLKEFHFDEMYIIIYIFVSIYIFNNIKFILKCYIRLKVVFIIK